jgi:hypothetical protein
MSTGINQLNISSHGDGNHHDLIIRQHGLDLQQQQNQMNQIQEKLNYQRHQQQQQQHHQAAHTINFLSNTIQGTTMIEAPHPQHHKQHILIKSTSPPGVAYNMMDTITSVTGTKNPSPQKTSTTTTHSSSNNNKSSSSPEISVTNSTNDDVFYQPSRQQRKRQATAPINFAKHYSHEIASALFHECKRKQAAKVDQTRAGMGRFGNQNFKKNRGQVQKNST